MSSSLSEKEVDQIVLNYLKKRGFAQAEAALKQEQQGKQQSMESMAFRQDMEAEMPATISNFIMNYQNAESSSPFRVSKYYSILREWVASALEMYQGELFSLLYPIFVHCYLEIVARGHSDEARTFMHLYKKDHLELHGDEIQRLQNVLTPDQMKENELVEMYKRNRFTVSISRFTLELLVSYLHENRFMFILSILNQYINFKSINALPPQAVEEYLAITGKPERERKTINERDHYWGLYEEVLPQSVLNALQQYRAKQKEIASAQEIENLESATKRQRSEKPSPLLPPEMEKPKQMSPGVRLPRMTEQMEYDLFEDLSKRVALSSTSLPSVCFYTAFNTYHGMNTMNFAQDGSICVAGFSDSTLRLWDIKNAGKGTSTTNNNNATGGRTDSKLLVGHSGGVFGCAVSPDNNWVLSSSADKTVRLWNAQTGNSMVCYKGHNYPVWDVEFSALGYYFATASHDKTARLWATDNIFPLRIFAGHLSDVNCVKFHPNCNYIATGSSDKSIRLWDINNASSVRIFTGLFGPVNCLALSPDGKYVAAADDQRIMVWDLATSRRLHTFTGHTRTIWSVDFSIESTLLASSGSDNTVRIWDLTTAKQQQGKQESNEAATIQPTAVTEEAAKATEEEKPKITASPELLKTFHTKDSPAFRVRFTRRNLLLAGGAFIAKAKQNKEPVSETF